MSAKIQKKYSVNATGDLISQEESSQNISEANLLTEQQRLILQDKLTKAVNDRTNGQSVSIHHVATSENVNNQKEWIESLKEISLQSSFILPENKKL